MHASKLFDVFCMYIHQSEGIIAFYLLYIYHPFCLLNHQSSPSSASIKASTPPVVSKRRKKRWGPGRFTQVDPTAVSPRKLKRLHLPAGFGRSFPCLRSTAGCFQIKRGTPKWMVYNGNPIWNGWFGGTPIFGNIQLMESFFFKKSLQLIIWINLRYRFLRLEHFLLHCRLQK